MVSEKGIHRISILITLVLHVLILLLPIPQKIMQVKKENSPTAIPVQLKIKEVIVKKKQPPAPKPVPKKTQSPRPSINPKPKPTPKPPPKPTSMPGDRKKALASKTIEPYYPKRAINNEWAGTVILEVTIDENGNILDIVVFKSSGHDILDDSFIETVTSEYTFKPKRVMGENQQDTIRIKYTYEN